MYPSASLSLAGKAQQVSEWDLIVLQVGPAQFDRALSEHIRDAKFFPTVAELRERAGMKKLDQDTVEANAAWEFVSRYVREHWHPDIGRSKTAPEIPPRTDYALRQIGGLLARNNVLMDSLPFMRKDFMEAYRLAPIEEQIRPKLNTMFDKKLEGAVLSLASAKTMEPKRPAREPMSSKPQPPRASHTREFLREQLRVLKDR